MKKIKNTFKIKSYLIIFSTNSGNLPTQSIKKIIYSSVMITYDSGNRSTEKSFFWKNNIEAY
jgi:hypothetical protein